MNFLASTDWQRAALLAMIFVMVVAGVVIGNNLFVRRLAIQRRMAETMHEDQFGGAATLRSDVTSSIWTKLIDKIEARGLSLADSRADGLRAKMIAAGYTSAYAPRWFTLIRLVLTLALPALIVGLLVASGHSLSIINVLSEVSS